jgi:hypothetical protein
MMLVVADASDAVSDNVFYRIIQVISNATETHVPSALRAFDNITKKYLHTTPVALYAYILGEFG